MISLVISNWYLTGVCTHVELINPVPCNCANLNCAAHKGALCSGQAFGKKCEHCNEPHYIGDGVVADDATLCADCGSYVMRAIHNAFNTMYHVHKCIPEDSIFNALSETLSLPIDAWVSGWSSDELRTSPPPQRFLKDVMYLLQFAARFCPPDLECRAIDAAVSMAEIFDSPHITITTD